MGKLRSFSGKGKEEGRRWSGKSSSCSSGKAGLWVHCHPGSFLRVWQVASPTQPCPSLGKSSVAGVRFNLTPSLVCLPAFGGCSNFCFVADARQESGPVWRGRQWTKKLNPILENTSVIKEKEILLDSAVPGLETLLLDQQNIVQLGLIPPFSATVHHTRHLGREATRACEPGLGGTASGARGMPVLVAAPPAIGPLDPEKLKSLKGLG